MSICRNPVNVISILIAHKGNEEARENEATEVLESEKGTITRCGRTNEDGKKWSRSRSELIGERRKRCRSESERDRKRTNEGKKGQISIWRVYRSVLAGGERESG